jgi:hypothetical protein
MELRRRLLELHRVLVDAEREAWERAHGRVTDRAFLDLLIKDPAFAWLGALTALIVRLDELAEEERQDRQALEDCTAKLRELLRPDEAGGDFQRRYAELVQRSPAVVVAHGAAMQVLRSP